MNRVLHLALCVALGSAAFCGACLLVWSIGCNINPNTCIANAAPTPVATARPCGCGTRSDRE